jgi:hypothetical protein
MPVSRDAVVDAINAGRYLIRRDGTDIARVTDRELVAAIAEVKARAEQYRTLLDLAENLAAEVTIEWSKQVCAWAEEINAIARDAVTKEVPDAPTV